MNGYSISGAGLQTGTFPDCNFVSQSHGQPAAGADWTITVPGSGEFWEIVAVRARFVTSSAVANRFLTFNVKDNVGNVVFNTAFGTAQTASITESVCLSPQFNAVAGDVSSTKITTLPLPEGPYLPGFTINSSTVAIDTGDQWSQIAVWFRQYGPDYGPGGTD